MSPRTWPEWIGIGLAWLAARLPPGLQRALGRMLGDYEERFYAGAPAGATG